MSHIKKLEECSVSKVNYIHDYVQILFINGSLLTVYSPYNVIKNGEEIALKGIEGLKIELVEVIENKTIIIEFENNISLGISIDNSVFNGPEALELNIPDEPIMVWDL